MQNIRYDQAIFALRELRVESSNAEYNRGAAEMAATLMGCKDVEASADALITLALHGKEVV